MKKILFVCMGNICRSPAAEGIMKKLVSDEKLEKQILVDSAGTINYHEGELPDARMREHAKIRGYQVDSLARQFNTKIDFEKYDYIITMDDYNFKVIQDWDKSKKYKSKILRMSDFSSDKSVTEVPDPYYGDEKDFENVLDILEDASKNLLKEIKYDFARDNKKKIETVLNQKIVKFNHVSGGCISDSRIIQTNSGNQYFIKLSNQTGTEMFLKEANGLNEIKSTNEIRTPEVKYCDDQILILEFINSSNPRKNFFEDFGRRFAKMHKHYSKSFGFYENNYIGSTFQINIPEEEEQSDWTKFYFNKRLLFQFNLAEKNGYVNDALRKSFIKLENIIDSILNCENIKPSLLHGDLWSGNYIVDENGYACLIDPAVYYGHRETDLAMTKLFGGFSREFYFAYNEEYPLEAGYEYRENIYKLYRVLNHLNLFGTAYLSQAVQLINYYI